jgi:predicted phosphohydrolase
MKLVMTSDLHGTHPTLPDGDALLVCGDCFVGDDMLSLRRDLDWLMSQPHRHKVLVAGNHDLVLVRHLDKIPDSVTYLANRTVILEGVRVHGLSWLGQPRVPHGVDVVIGHRPPLGVLDAGQGDATLYQQVVNARPKVMAFGHAHGCAGSMQWRGVAFYNCAESPLARQHFFQSGGLPLRSTPEMVICRSFVS